MLYCCILVPYYWILKFFNFDIDVNQFSHLTLVSMPKIDFIGSQF